ncbi:START domain-containing protein [Plasmodiophora brassicae]
MSNGNGFIVIDEERRRALHDALAETERRLVTLAETLDTDSKSWRHVKRIGDVNIYKYLNAPPTGSPSLSVMMSETTITASPEQIMQYITSDFFAYLKAIDEMLIQAVYLYPPPAATSGLRLFRSEYALPWPCTNRDFVVAQRCRTDVRGAREYYTSTATSFEHPDVREVSKFVRGHVNGTQTMWWPVDESRSTCQVRNIFHVDPKGDLPTVIVNQSSVSQGANLERFAKIFSK